MAVQTILTIKKQTLSALAIATLLLVTHVHTNSISSGSNGIPKWEYVFDTAYFSYVSDRSPVTSITVNHDLTSSYLYGLVVNGLDSVTFSDGTIMRPCPNYSTGFTFKQTVILTASQSIAKVEAWSYTPNNVSYFLTQISFVLSDGTT
jgi:hypothetical protein